MPYLLGSRYRAQTGQFTSLHKTPVGWFHARSLHLIRTIGSEYLSHSAVVLEPAGLPEVVTRLVRVIQLIRRFALSRSMARATPGLGSGAIARTEDERSESEVASEIGHSQSAERAIACSVTVISLRNPANPPSDTHAL